MDNYTISGITNKGVWEKFLLSQKPNSFLQSWNWGQVHKDMGEKIFRLGLYNNKSLVGIFLIIKEVAKRGPHLLIPAGPIINWDNISEVTFFIDYVKKLALKENTWFIRIRPEILDTSENRNLFKKLKSIYAPMHLNAENTWILDIDKPEDILLSEMRKSTRYLIKKSQNEGLQINKSINKNDSKILFDLQKETSIRHKFVGFPLKLFQLEIDYFGRDNNAILFTCKKNKLILASAIIVFYGNSAYYHFSGSTSRFSNIPFSYYLQWEVIKESKKRGLKQYNFWGIAPNDNPKHRFAGVTLFKTGFGGRRIDWLHARDLPVSSFYYLTYAFETFRRIFRRL
ncbi:MAG: peptidoglycan bridge formation glycyltransferase FemA/FemB family protein [Candidatus Woesebacteria bacterium]|nr:peptidoglycan bridge formation glycyltransferase FemA/FemB family protein [Candidatus Woesebacteria bacterium]